MIFSQNSHREEILVGVFMCGYWAEHLEIQIKLIKIHCEINFRNRPRIPFPFQTKKIISACRSEKSVIARRFIIRCFRCRYLFLNLNNCGCFKDFKRTSSGIMRGIGDLLHTVSVLYWLIYVWMKISAPSPSPVMILRIDFVLYSPINSNDV